MYHIANPTVLFRPPTDAIMSENGQSEKDYHVNMGFSGDHSDSKGYGATEPATSDTAKVVENEVAKEDDEVDLAVDVEGGCWDARCHF